MTVMQKEFTQEEIAENTYYDTLAQKQEEMQDVEADGQMRFHVVSVEGKDYFEF